MTYKCPVPEHFVKSKSIISYTLSYKNTVSDITQRRVHTFGKDGL